MNDSAGTDWRGWHDDYDDPASRLSQRLTAVRRRLRDAVDQLPPGPIRLVSACAGQARDVVGVFDGHPRVADVEGRLVELDTVNAEAARAGLARVGLTEVQVVEDDAGVSDAYAGVVPADLVLLCGVFGNISDADVLRTVRAAPMLCLAGATVFWTRGRREPDLTPTIRTTFAEVGFDEVAFDSGSDPASQDGTWSVGTHRLVGNPMSLRPGLRLFTFTR